MQLTIELKEKQWAEIIYALESKIVYIKRGDYGRSNGEINIDQWVADLDTAHDAVVDALTAAGGTY
jgi:hypothetical protein